uniref:7TM GPCR serpentine receptor class x (Srx) domain-containing protein n=1 Tax=Panagrolaimus sp. PS1159 TaxID=55785 RepID=A0AC35GIC4_9BILA
MNNNEDEGDIEIMISRILGGILTIACIISLFLNITLLLTLWFGSFLNTKQSGIYIFAFANIFGNCFTVMIFGGYLGPAIMAQNSLFSSLDPWPKFLGLLFHIQWFQDMFLQIITAINRLIAVVNPRASQFFTRKTIIGLVLGCYIFGLIFAIIAGYLLPCCALYLYWRKFSFYYIDKSFNYADNILDWPINSIASIIPIFCYIRIYLYVKTSNKKIITTIAESKAAERKSKETKCALQFAACTGFSICKFFYSFYEY